jgi:hypothetical protein
MAGALQDNSGAPEDAASRTWYCQSSAGEMDHAATRAHHATGRRGRVACKVGVLAAIDHSRAALAARAAIPTVRIVGLPRTGSDLSCERALRRAASAPGKDPPLWQGVPVPVLAALASRSAS